MMKSVYVAAMVALGFVISPRDLSAQAKKTSTAAMLELVGMSGQHRTLTAADLAKLPRVESEASSHNVTGKYSGVRLSDLLHLVGAPRSDSIRGPALAQYAFVEASDNYHAVFALAELDSGFTDRLVFLADSKNGSALDSTEGPFRIIAVGERRPARWVKNVRKIELKKGSP